MIFASVWGHMEVKVAVYWQTLAHNGLYICIRSKERINFRGFSIEVLQTIYFCWKIPGNLVWQRRPESQKCLERHLYAT